MMDVKQLPHTSNALVKSLGSLAIEPIKPAHGIILPQEVLDLIIDEIGTPPEDRDTFLEHQRTLRSFLFVSSAFRTRSLSILFRRLAVTAHNQLSLDRIRALTEILKSPFGPAFDSAGRHLQEITVSFLPGFEHDDDSYRVLGRETPIRDVMGHQWVIDLFRTLYTNAPNLCAFFLHIKPDDSVDWTTLDAGFQQALRNLVRSRSLIHLQIAHISRLPSTFIKGAQIKVLQVYQLLDDSDASDFSAPNLGDINLPDPPLEIFITDHTYPFGTDGEHLQSTSLFARLRILVTFIGSQDDSQRTWKIIAASPFLANLQLDQMGHIEGPPPDFNLGKLNHLKGFVLTHNRTSFTPYVPGTDRSLIGLYDLLNVPVPMETFEHLEIEFKFQEYNVPTNFFFPDEKSDNRQWDELDKLLSGPKYPSLKQVSLGFRVTIRVHPAFKDFDNQAFLEFTARRLKDEFPRLNDSKTVDFSITVESMVLVAVSIFDEQ
ncbi:hypothetical protein JR316_0007872 [Psilocybe cubensis]|uniref:Uncharacterized protein n=2 Tax=Psilocybe cubensis TaxID=181762 RepID=A0A8H7XT21_PSICU|nr:hypothetical protein JR316_0007872 [Psilocybe cubensis]KAH9479284.1 hypothetical protein JR316_0007872 [Psilocybe cubensis]